MMQLSEHSIRHNEDLSVQEKNKLLNGVAKVEDVRELDIVINGCMKWGPLIIKVENRYVTVQCTPDFYKELDATWRIEGDFISYTDGFFHWEEFKLGTPEYEAAKGLISSKYKHYKESIDNEYIVL